MFDHYVYLLTDVGCLLFPLLFSFHPRYHFVSDWRYFWPIVIPVALVFIGWDVLFTRSGVWGFNTRYISGVELLGLPVEECLFFICIPYATVFTYYCVRRYVRTVIYEKAARAVSVILSICLLAVAAGHLQHLYTSVAFVSLAVLLGILVVAKARFLAAFYISFFLILVPFFLSNGLLTGWFTPEPVVWYNDNHNLGIRMGTIPVEDTFYGMLLVLLNVSGFEFLRGRREALQ